MRACEPYLAAEIESLDPMFILALGRAALWVLLRETTVSAWRGDWWELDRARETLVLVTYHPAFVLRQGLGSEAHSQFHDDVCMFANKVIANAGKDPRGVPS
jgi:uracil-DNA glycosylase family 4